MKDDKKFEKYQDFLNKRKMKQIRNSNNDIKIENRTEPSSNFQKKKTQNVIQSYISEIKRQMQLRNKNDDKIQTTVGQNQKDKNKKDNTKKKNIISTNKNYSTDISYYNKENKKNISNRKKYYEKLSNSDKNKNKSVNKIQNYSDNCFTENKNIMRYNFSSDYIPNNKELDHILSSYDFKSDNELGDINISTKIHFRNLLSLVNELKAKNELLKKELRNKDNLISSLEKMNLNKNKKGMKNDKNMNDFIRNEYNNNILLDNQRLKSEIL